MSKQKKPCIFGCNRLAAGNGEICTTCKQGLRYWDDKDHADILKREETLKVWGARMHQIVASRTRRSRSVTRVRAASRAEARV